MKISEILLEIGCQIELNCHDCFLKEDVDEAFSILNSISKINDDITFGICILSNYLGAMFALVEKDMDKEVSKEIH